MKVYVDVIVFENFIIDLFLLQITCKILRYKISKKIYFAALLGGVYSLVVVVKSLNYLTLFLFQTIIAFFMLRISVGKLNLKDSIKALSVFYVNSVLLCGTCLALSNINRSYSISNDYVIKDNFIKEILIAIIIIYLFANKFISYLKDRSMITNFLYQVEITINNVKYTINSFLDTGNELKEPITNLPCIIVENKFINKESIENLKTYHVPYSAIGGTGYLEGVVVDKVRIKGESSNKWKEIDAIICFCNETLSSSNEFNALLSRGII